LFLHPEFFGVADGTRIHGNWNDGVGRLGRHRAGLFENDQTERGSSPLNMALLYFGAKLNIEKYQFSS
jgi:hypothetical protein